MHEEKLTQAFSPVGLVSIWTKGWQRTWRKPEEGYLPSPRLSSSLWHPLVPLCHWFLCSEVHGNVVCFLSRLLTNTPASPGDASTSPWLHLDPGFRIYRSLHPHSVQPFTRTYGLNRIVRINNQKEAVISRSESIN